MMLKAIPKEYHDSAKGTLKLLWEDEWRAMGMTQVRGTFRFFPSIADPPLFTHRGEGEEACDIADTKFFSPHIESWLGALRGP